jgi:tetratricopeptide (TPR) repeat protein
MLITARRYEKKQQSDSALIVYASAYEKYLDPRIYFYIGRIQSKQKKYKEAMDSLMVYIDSHLDDDKCSLMKEALALHSDAARRERRSVQAVVAVGRFSERFRVARRPRWLGPHPRDGEGAGK